MIVRSRSWPRRRQAPRRSRPSRHPTPSRSWPSGLQAPSRRQAPHRAAALLAITAIAAIVGACTGGGAPILANPPAFRPAPPAASPTPSRPADPQPIVFPRDDGAHDRLTEWWYYTGHLRDPATGDRYGFEFVVFRAERGDFPISWVSHLAITDEHGNRFLYAQRAEIGPQVDQRPIAGGFDLALLPATGATAATGATGAAGPADSTAPSVWRMTGVGGEDVLVATTTAPEAAAAGAPGGLGLDLHLTSTKPPALHNGAGFIDFGAGGGSYYYSRTRMTATGSIVVDGRRLEVDGEAWFDHQWGDFIAIGGGWDWFAVNLDDGTDLTLSIVRDAGGQPLLVYGTLVAPDGKATHLPAAAFDVVVTARWTSPHTGATYPAGWRLTLPGQGLVIDLQPTVADQELDTRPTTGVVYWEGSQAVRATRDGAAVGGQAYVELTGYAGPGSSGPIEASPTASSAP
jgi:predicted secreted hydrolase